MEKILETKALSKRYGDIIALNRISIEINRGDIYGIVGKNGAGKTTLMKLINGLTEKSGGELELFGKASDDENIRRKIGTIVEIPEFFDYFTGYQNLEYFRIQRGIADKNCVMEALELVELLGFEHRKFKKYSLGMKQRLGLALALMGKAEFLVLDEPINGIDPEGIVKLRNLLLNLNREKGVTIFISSHILSEISNLANRFGIIDEGIIIEEFTREELENKTGEFIEIKSDNLEKTVVLLESKFNYNNYKVNGDNAIILYEGLDNIKEINQYLMHEGIGVTGISRKSASLEDYFISIVGGAKND